MATYFDPEEEVDLALLHPDVRAHSDLARVANAAEADIVEQFTKQGTASLRDRATGAGNPFYYYTENGVWYTVHLMGYHATPSSAAGYAEDRADWTGLCEAMRWTVADVTTWRLLHYDDDPDVTAETHGRESWTYRAGRDTRWPPNWDRRLRRYVQERNDPRIVYGL